MLVVKYGCKITKKNPNSTILEPVNGILSVFTVVTGPKYYCRGAEEQAFGARIRIALAIVGAMRSTVVGVVKQTALTPAPYNTIGKGINAAREKKFS